jgi:hypothetical protein
MTKQCTLYFANGMIPEQYNITISQTGQSVTTLMKVGGMMGLDMEISK